MYISRKILHAYKSRDVVFINSDKTTLDTVLAETYSSFSSKGAKYLEIHILS